MGLPLKWSLVNVSRSNSAVHSLVATIFSSTLLKHWRRDISRYALVCEESGFPVFEIGMHLVAFHLLGWIANRSIAMKMFWKSCVLVLTVACINR